MPHLRYGVAVQDPDHDVLLELVLDDTAPHHAGGHGFPEQPVLGQGVARVVSALVYRALLYLQQKWDFVIKAKRYKGAGSIFVSPVSLIFMH